MAPIARLGIRTDGDVHRNKPVLFLERSKLMVVRIMTLVISALCRAPILLDRAAMAIQSAPASGRNVAITSSFCGWKKLFTSDRST